MGLDIKRNRAGKYKVSSAISDELLTEEWVSADEVKKLLILREYHKFKRNVIEIATTFPSGYYVNGKAQSLDAEYAHKVWVVSLFAEPNADAILEAKYREVCTQLGLELM